MRELSCDAQTLSFAGLHVGRGESGLCVTSQPFLPAGKLADSLTLQQ